MAFAFMFGGASRLHELRLSLVELAALPLLVLAIKALASHKKLNDHRLAFGIVGAAALLPIIQLIPLPPVIWSGLPGRDQMILALDLIDQPQGFVPLSLTPDKTWRSFLAIIPPLAVFLGVLVIGSGTRVRLVQAIIAGTIFSILFGAAQLASGTDKLYLWPTTDAGSMVGFFANRNHLASLCLVSIPFATVLGTGALRRNGQSQLPLWLTAIYIALIAVALGVIRSRAGVVLFGPVLIASLLAAWIAAGKGRPRPLLLAIAGSATLAMVAVGIFAAGPILERFDEGSAREGRFENWPIVMAAAETYLPLGSGLGSFDAVYRSVEPLEQLDPTFFNQAHNDYLETWLEAGWLGLGLVVAFLVWFGRRSWTAWRSGISTARDLQRASTIAIGALLIHSAADYPLRTVLLATIFALCCSVLELASRPDEELTAPRSRRRRR